MRQLQRFYLIFILQGLGLLALLSGASLLGMPNSPQAHVIVQGAGVLCMLLAFALIYTEMKAPQA